MSQDVCPWNVRFAGERPEGSPFAARDALAGRDARALARMPSGMTVDELSAAFKRSSRKRGKLRELKRTPPWCWAPSGGETT